MDRISARHDQAAAGPIELIGREPEIQQLRLFVSRIAQGAGEALLLSGDPGVGKTSLLDYAAAIDRRLRDQAAAGDRLAVRGPDLLRRPPPAPPPVLRRAASPEPIARPGPNVALGLGEGPPPAQLLIARAVLSLLASRPPGAVAAWLPSAKPTTRPPSATPPPSARPAPCPLRPARPVGAPRSGRSRHPHRPPHRRRGPRRRRPRLPPRPALPTAAPGRPRRRGHHRTSHRHRLPRTGDHRTGQRPLALRPGPHPAHLRLPPAPHQAHHRRPPPAGRRRGNLPPARSSPWAARADRELRATGITVSTADTGLASLTPQQRQIALLAAAGHTNKEIAARLFLSPRTVSTHLYQVFPKLGITSRAALRDALADTPAE